MTAQQLRRRLNRAGAYILAGNPSLTATLDDLQTAAKRAGLPEISNATDPLAIAVTQAATTLKEDWMKLRPTPLLRERRETIFKRALESLSAA